MGLYKRSVYFGVNLEDNLYRYQKKLWIKYSCEFL